MSWDKVSDFEINKAVAIKNGEHDFDIVELDALGLDSGFYSDYCNSWADMGPIALSSNIVIPPCMGSNKSDATGYFEHENPITKEFEDNNEALRAAAIVYLMMNGVRLEDLG